jgi:hypothetical protein
MKMTINVIHLANRYDRERTLEKEMKEQDVIDYRVWDGIIDPKTPSRGISKAHKQIVKYARNNSLHEILIAEDDLKFTSKGAFKFFLKNKPKDFDIYLAGIYIGKINDDNTVKDFSGLTCYIINQRFFDTFLSMPEQCNIDRCLKNKGKFIVCNPFAVIQYHGFSDNVKRYCNYDSYLIGRKLFESRTLASDIVP